MEKEDKVIEKVEKISESESECSFNIPLGETPKIGPAICIGQYAGADFTELLPGTVIIGDNIRNLDPTQNKDAIFFGNRIAFGNYVFGKYLGLKDRIEGAVLPDTDLSTVQFGKGHTAKSIMEASVQISGEQSDESVS